MSLNVNFNSFLLSNYRISLQPAGQSNDGSFLENMHTNSDDTYVTWRYDEYGNIVYYKYNKKTGELISKEVFKNPAAEIKKWG